MLETTPDSPYPGRAIVDLGAIGENLEVLRGFAPGAAQMAVVKADAYGHGILPVATAALRAGAAWLGVAQLAEARALREGLNAAGIDRSAAPILAWIAPSGADWAGALEACIDLSVSWTWVLAEICAAARDTGIRARIHVKIDTGMSRAGSTRADLPALAAAVRMAEEEGLVEVVGAWSHLSRGDDLSEEGRASTAAHVEIFERGLKTLADAGVEPRIRHLSATSGILWHPEAHYDMVRAGIGMYGLSPDPLTASGASLGLRPAMTLQAPLTSVKVVEGGAPASYGGTWRAPGRRWLGLVPLGYADGILRAGSNGAPVLVEGPEAITTRVVGRICMDQFIVDLGPAEDAPGAPSARSGPAPAKVGDTAILFGDPAKGAPSADDWAQAAGTINYEIVTRLGDRVPRVHLSDRRVAERAEAVEDSAACENSECAAPAEGARSRAPEKEAR
ncbi:MAG: alanine racemase [Schaalia hyovaginalis]|uniref:alanine racemase n=1 Tax=Schaalia hyovaginalis TaxID=29316 RepID=UPI002A9116EC|nr:alanine racemase [Schaalia hyovaginalis]MDY5600530.1 alanine racemase [Schaalia hyovaginalis]